MSSSQETHAHLIYPRGSDNIVRCYKHALPARRFTSHTLLNPNRDFWKCDLDNPAACSFFFWDDERSPSQSQRPVFQPSATLSPSPSDTAPTYSQCSRARASKVGPSSSPLCSVSTPTRSFLSQMAPKPQSPITPERTTSAKPTTPVSRTRSVPKLRQQRIDAIQAGLDSIASTESGARSLAGDRNSKLPSAFPNAVTKTPTVKMKSSSFKPITVPAPSSLRTDSTSASPTSSPGPSAVKAEPVNSDVLAHLLDTTESEEELWANTQSSRTPYTTPVISSTPAAGHVPAAATPTSRPHSRGTAGLGDAILSDEVDELPSVNRARTSPVPEPTRAPPSAMKSKGNTRAAPASSDEDLFISSDDSFSPGSPGKRKRTSASTSRPAVEDATDIDDAPPSPPKRHQGLRTPPTSSPVRSAVEEDEDMVPLVPGGFDFERERTRSVSPLTGRDKSKVRRRVAYPTSPSKAGVRFALPAESRPIYPILPKATSSRQDTLGSSFWTRSSSRSAGEAPTGMSVDLISDLALRMTERAGAMSGDALRLKSLELYVRGIERKLASSEERERVKDAEITRLKERIRSLEEYQ